MSVTFSVAMNPTLRRGIRYAAQGKERKVGEPMLIYLLAFVGGVLTILSPCILPVLPFVFARADQSFRRSSLPLLGGMVLTFSVVAIAAAFGGHWIVRLNQGGRYVAMIVFFVLGLTLLFPSLAEFLTRPLVRAGSGLQSGPSGSAGVGKSFLLGISTGLLWTPCAGPILGLILTGAAIQGPGARTSFLLLSFALGAATSLGLALFAGNKAFAAMKRSLSFEVWIRRGLGVAVIMGVVAISLRWDTNLLSKFSFVNTSKAEEHLIGALDSPRPVMAAAPVESETPDLQDEGPMPAIPSVPKAPPIDALPGLALSHAISSLSVAGSRPRRADRNDGLTAHSSTGVMSRISSKLPG